MAAPQPRVRRLALVALAGALAAAAALPGVVLAQPSGAPSESPAPSSGPQPSPRPGGDDQGGEGPGGEAMRLDREAVAALPDGVSVENVEYRTGNELRLTLRSAAMPASGIEVAVLLPRDFYADPERTFPELWLLDDAATEKGSGWLKRTNLARFMADKNVLTVLPLGGQRSAYSDWADAPAAPDGEGRWRQLLADELPGVTRAYLRSNGTRAVVGAGSGGAAALSLAGAEPEQFSFAGSLSGVLDTEAPGVPGLLDEELEPNLDELWGSPGGEQWQANNPMRFIPALSGLDVYVSAGTGLPESREGGSPARRPVADDAAGLEAAAGLSSRGFVRSLEDAGGEPIGEFPAAGLRAWEFWQLELSRAWAPIAASLGLDGEESEACKASPRARALIEGSAALSGCLAPSYTVERDGTEITVTQAVGGLVLTPEEGEAGIVLEPLAGAYRQAGGPAGSLGLPTGPALPVDGDDKPTPPAEWGEDEAIRQDFAGGAIIGSKKSGFYAVPRPILAAYDERGGAAELGLPEGPAEDGGQSFADGEVRADDTTEGE